MEIVSSKDSNFSKRKLEREWLGVERGEKESEQATDPGILQ